jgi:plasmid stabilization system protein ParE
VATIIWTEESELWLKNIFDYIARDNPVAANNVINGIYQ